MTNPSEYCENFDIGQLISEYSKRFAPTVDKIEIAFNAAVTATLGKKATEHHDITSGSKLVLTEHGYKLVPEHYRNVSVWFADDSAAIGIGKFDSFTGIVGRTSTDDGQVEYDWTELVDLTVCFDQEMLDGILNDLDRLVDTIT